MDYQTSYLMTDPEGVLISELADASLFIRLRSSSYHQPDLQLGLF